MILIVEVIVGFASVSAIPLWPVCSGALWRCRPLIPDPIILESWRVKVPTTGLTFLEVVVEIWWRVYTSVL